MEKSSNEADDQYVDQPRFLFDGDHVTGRTSPPIQSQSRINHQVWGISCLSILLLIAILACWMAPDVFDTPPELQTSQVPVPTAPPHFSYLDSKSTEPVIRVNVTPGGLESFQLEVRGSCRFSSLETGLPLQIKLGAGETTVTSGRSGLKLGTNSYSTAQMEIVPDQSPSIRINGHLYRGKIRLFRRTDGKVSAVNVLPIEEYLAGVIDSEMPAAFPEAARQAQAIVARTYALYQIEKAEPKAVFDLLSSQRSQKYQGVEYRNRSGRRLAGESESSRRIAAVTRGVVCRREKHLFCTYYSAVCGGRTTDGRAVFRDAADLVRSVPCEWCRQSPHYRWTTQLPAEDFQRRGLYRSEEFALVSVHQESGPGDGTVSRFRIDDGQKPIQISGIQLRERLPAGVLSSPHFRIILDDQNVIFEGRGHGHGVGFCQWGAKGQAEEGRDCQQILRHYYPGVEIVGLNY